MKKEPVSEFARRVYAVVATIPEGKVATYGQVAGLAGNPFAARQAGYCISAVSNDRNLPCHRVVNRLGELAPEHAFGGYHIQRMLLEAEGITFLENGRIDMKQHGWQRLAAAGR